MRGARLVLFTIILTMLASVALIGVNPNVASAEDQEVEMILIDGYPPPIKAPAIRVPTINIPGVLQTISNVPAFNWTYGCSATTAAMMFGHYDNDGFANFYTGPVNNGVCPMNNSAWGPGIGGSSGECPINATHKGKDNRTTRGHVDDYWIAYGNDSQDPYMTGGWTKHTNDCAGDFMGTNQYTNGQMMDGGTYFFDDPSGNRLVNYTGSEPYYIDGCHGLRDFSEYKGYTVKTNYTQYIKGRASNPNVGFTFEDFKAQIDAGRPVFIQVTSHSMLGYGYNTTGNIIYIHDTWDYSDHQMTWGGTYAGSLQHYAVTVLELEGGGGTTPPPTPPSISTYATTNITTTTARFNGNLTSLGSFTNITVLFEYGTSQGGPYSNVTSSLSRNAIGTFSVDASTLQSNTKYYYRAKAVDIGTGLASYGLELNFTTNASSTAYPVPTAPNNGTTISNLNPRLAWTITTGATSYRVQISTVNTFTTTVMDQSGITNTYYDVGAGLNWGSTYYWRVNATTATGTTVWSAVWNFRTNTGPAPNPPGNLVATVISSSQIDLTWTDTSTNETNIIIERKTGATGLYATLTTLPANSTAYSNKYLPASTTYYYRLKAMNSNGSSGYSNEVNARTLETPPAIPVLSSPTSGSSVATLTPTLTWRSVTGASTYKLQISSDMGFNGIVINQSGISGTTFTVPSDLGGSTNYYWKVASVSSTGSASNFCSAWFFRTPTGPPPTAPSGLIATTVSSSKIDLTWTDNSNNETLFAIERKVGSGGSFSQIATVAANKTTYSSTGLSPNTLYTYRVKAINSSSNQSSAYSNEAEATTMPSPPPTPTLSAPANNSYNRDLTLTLSWNNSTGASTYKLQVATDMSFTSLIVDVSGLTTNSYTVNNLNLNTLYYWRVAAVGSSGSSSNWTVSWSFRTKAN